MIRNRRSFRRSLPVPTRSSCAARRVRPAWAWSNRSCSITDDERLWPFGLVSKTKARFSAGLFYWAGAPIAPVGGRLGEQIRRRTAHEFFHVRGGCFALD